MYLPAEWHHQAFVQLTWPHAQTDWAPILDEVYECYLNIAREISLREPLVIVTQYPDEVRAQLSTLNTQQKYPIHIIQCDTNDTWARDHGFITLLNDDDTQAILYDYQFNGWGLKFPADLDNQINRHIYPQLPLHGNHQYLSRLNFVLEGGSIESDGQGTILTTKSCLLAPNRNNLSKEQIEQQLIHDFCAHRVLWLHHGHLAGDDTDGHIDTLARLCPDNTIAYVQCTDPRDEHHEDLKCMEAELQALRTADGRPYRLFPLPMPDAIYDGVERLPATYANYLIINGAVLYPTYRQPEHDEQAKRQLMIAFPHYEVVGIDCSVLIRQRGSLHCCTMQYPTIN